MLHIHLVAFGKCREPYLREACGEYEKRLRPYCRLETTQLTPTPLPERPSPAQVRAALEAEARLALAAIPSQAIAAALCVEGGQLSSEGFSRWLEEAALRGGRVCFLIGSAHGLDESLKRRAALRLSLSEMTFPHQLARVMLLEQIYRGFQISGGGKYHKQMLE
ncbi:MAG: 23S rRNA (pseudouridine(1915)-N(3))-methyltransferase RlmH [Oscillospiraceae bacterium]|nr:23S rRNA (pseudouridine(1915)-N(3))-methyltransferase RlmH [Oscillospiraceae bacterium]